MNGVNQLQGIKFEGRNDYLFSISIKQETYFSGHDSARGVLLISSRIELEKGIETSNSATK